jgi:hypothetical protein
MKTEIVLNPDVEIVNDDDRKLYWQFRMATDSKFLAAMHNHNTEGDHSYHACFNQYLDIRQLSLKQFIDSNGREHHAQDIIDQLVDSIGNELTEAITNMIALIREAERRGLRFK